MLENYLNDREENTEKKLESPMAQALFVTRKKEREKKLKATLCLLSQDSEMWTDPKVACRD